MKDKLISIEIAHLAKNKGFNEETSHYYDLIDNKLKHTIEGFSNPNEDCMIDIELEWHNHSNFNRLAAPTQSLLQKYLWENYAIYIEIQFSPISKSFRAKVFYPILEGYGWLYCKPDHMIPENATEQGLIEALKLIP